MNGFRQSHAIVIGINEYRNGIPPLRTAVNDATHIAEVLERGFGYAVQLLTDVTREKLRLVFDESLPRLVERDDRLLVYFAGHGVALDGDDGPAGYIVPQDARSNDSQSFLPMTDLSGWLDRLPCRHLLLVLDCCFAGAFRWSSTRDLGTLPEVIHRERFDRYIRDSAWQVVTSSAYDQKALDVLAGETIGLRAPDVSHGEHSPFAAAFLRALQGEADLYPRAGPGGAGGDGVITATELYLYLRGSVEGEAEVEGHRQTPGLWPLKKHDKGEYIHLVPGHELNLPPAPELNDANNPYRGLQSFDKEHATLFFGRKQFVRKLAECVSGQPLTVVLGASGTGKSSVVKAGMLNELETSQPGVWRILPPIRPGKSPLASLAGLTFPGEAGDAIASQLAEFWIDPEGLAARVGAWAAREAAGRLLLVIDQFEELITLCWDAGERDQFLRLLARALAAHPERLHVVLTLRSDFEPQFANTQLQGQWMASRIVVPTMTLDEYREAIEGPASVRVLYFKGKNNSQEFINRLIGDVASTPGALPLLSFTLSELYRRYLERGGEDRSLGEDDYEQLGGVGGSLRNRANEVYDNLSDDASRETMRRVMLRMISVEAGELARRRVSDAELVYREPGENARVSEVLGRLTEARLVVEGKETDDQPYVEPAHDELIRGWNRLLEWARRDQEGLLLRRILNPAAEDWKRGTGGLWHANPRLSLVRRVLQSPESWFNRTESEFVERSVRKRRKLLITTIGAVATAFVVLLGITQYALTERTRAVNGESAAVKNAGIAQEQEGIAKEQTLIAQKREATATSREFAALSTAERTKRLDRSLLLAVEAVRTENNIEARDSLYKALRDRPGLTTFLHVEEGDVRSIAFSPDGKTLAAGYGDADDGGGLVVWDVSSRKRILDERFHDRELVISVAFSPDGKMVAAGYGAGGGGVMLWDVAGKKRLMNERLPGGARGISFSRDGNILAAGYSSIPSGAVLFDVTTRKRLTKQPLEVREGYVCGIAFNPDGKALGVAYGGGIVLYDVGTRKRLAGEALTVREGSVESFTFSRDGRSVAAGYGVGGYSTAGGLVVWDFVTRKRLAEKPLIMTEGRVNSVAFSPDGKALLVGYDIGGFIGSAGGIAVWEVDSRKRIREESLPVRPGVVTSVDCCSDGKTLAAGFSVGARAGGSGVVLWNQPPQEVLAEEPLIVHDGELTAQAISPDGKSLATVWSARGARGGVDLWDLAARKRVGDRSLDVPEAAISSVAFSPDGKALAVGCSKGMVLWNLVTHKPVGEKPFDMKGDVSSIAFSPNGESLAAGLRGDPGGVVLWDVATRKRLPDEPLPVPEGEVCNVAFSPDGKSLAGGFGRDNSGGVVLWDVATRKRLPDVPLKVAEGQVTSMAFSALAPVVAAGYSVNNVSLLGGVVLWDAATRKRINVQPMPVTEGIIRGLAISGTSKLLAAGYFDVRGAGDGTVLWDIATNERFIDEPLTMRAAGVRCLGFSPERETLAVGYAVSRGRGFNGMVLWDLDLDSWQHHAGRIANRNFTRAEWRRYFHDRPYRPTFVELPGEVSTGNGSSVGAAPQ